MKRSPKSLNVMHFLLKSNESTQKTNLSRTKLGGDYYQQSEWADFPK